MKAASGITLLCAITTLGMAGCSPSPEGSDEPIAGAESTQSPSGEGTGLAQDESSGDGGQPTEQNGVDVNRLRLPDMEKLPSESELTSREKPDNNGGGVIARPPSVDN